MKNANIASLILEYDDIEIVNGIIQNDILLYNNIVTNIKEIYENIKYNNILKFKDYLKFKEESILIINPN